MTPRNLRQFGLHLLPMGALINCGIGPRLNASYNKTYIAPNNLMEGEGVQDISIAGNYISVFISGFGSDMRCAPHFRQH